MLTVHDIIPSREKRSKSIMKPRISGGIDGVSSLNESMSQLEGNYDAPINPATDVKFRITSNKKLIEASDIPALPPIIRPGNDLQLLQN